MLRGKASDAPGTHVDRAASSAPAPGKRTLVEQLGSEAPPVQRKAAGTNDAAGSADPAAIARRGVETGAAPLPHLDRIQAAFGRHDVSGVKAHHGGAANTAARSLGAEAYAFGDSVAFAAPPDLHTAAHEAAHVVQQRGGVQLKGGIDQPGDSYERHADAVADAVVAGHSAAPLLDEMAAGTTGGPAVQRKPGGEGAPTTSVTPPKPGINKNGFIDNDEGANIRTGPAESGGQKVREQPLPPAARVYVSGTHPDAPQWLYVTAYLEEMMLRGYVQDFRVTTDAPEPLARLHQVKGGETAEQLATQEFASSVTDGHDLRFYENVLLYVNQQAGRAGITGTYQSPNIVGGGGNNIQLVAGQRIWLVSAAYAKALQNIVPSGSLTGGAVAQAKRIASHIEDILRSVKECPQYLGEVAGQYAQAIREHEAAIIGIVAGFIMAEAGSAFLATIPTGVTQIAAFVIQLILSAFGAAGMIQASLEAGQHAGQWLNLAWTAKGDPAKIEAASKEFLRMLVSLAIAALALAGASSNFGNALKIADAIPTGGLTPAMATVGGGVVAGGAQAGAAEGVAIGAGPGSLGLGGVAAMSGDQGSGGTPESGPKIPEGLDKRLVKVIKDTIERARKGELLKASNYHPHFDDATVADIIKNADAIYESQGKAGRLIFRKADDIVVVEGPSSGQGNVVTGYGPRGIKTQSGASALGGSPFDQGAPITHEMIINGTIPVQPGQPPIPKAVQVAP